MKDQMDRQPKKEERRTFSLDWRRVKAFFGKRSVIMAAMLTLLVVTGALSIKYAGIDVKPASGGNKTAETENVDAAVSADETNEDSVEVFFSEYRSERNSVRSQEISYLNSIIEDQSTDVSIINEAQTRKLEITDTMEKEVTVEGLLRAKGFPDVIVTLGNETINVVLGLDSITSTEAAQILDTVMTETGSSADSVRIIPAG